ncbi:serine-rich adhesin for platelets isoform X2 [Amia ocellicauda]|uniref:serine-rich adhesin for platelets isoform X2 n=1 Tax=Amia ocellicauda TaxID=2972642 RepID=UPI0034649E09
MSASHAGDEQRWAPTHVQVTVLRARGLRAKGKHGTSDVYTIIQVGKEKFSTSVAEKTTSPEWKEECSFELLPGVLEAGGRSAYPPGSSDLVLTVMHRALIGLDVFLGHADIPLDKVFQERIPLRNEWYKLHSKSGKKEKERGEVQVTVQFTRNNLTASMYDLSVKDKPRSTFGKLKDKMKSKKRGEESASAIVPSGYGALSGRVSRTASEGGEVEEDEEELGPREGKKSKMKNFFQKAKLHKSADTHSNTSLASESSVSSSPGGSLSPTAGISVVVSDLSNSPSNSSNLTVDSPVHTIQPSPRLPTHKRAFSDEASQIAATQPQPRAVESLKARSGVLSKSSLCINGSHVYNEPTAPAPVAPLPTTLGLLQKSSPLSRSLQNLTKKSEDPHKALTDARRWSLDKPEKEPADQLSISAQEGPGRGTMAHNSESKPVHVTVPMVSTAAESGTDGKKHRLNLFSHGKGDSSGKGGEGGKGAEPGSGQAHPPSEEKHKAWFGSKDPQNKPSSTVWASPPSSGPGDSTSTQDGIWQSSDLPNEKSIGLIGRQSSEPAVSFSSGEISRVAATPCLFSSYSMSEALGEWDESFDAFAASRLKPAQKDKLTSLQESSFFLPSSPGLSSCPQERSTSAIIGKIESEILPCFVQAGNAPPVPPRKPLGAGAQEVRRESWLDRAQELTVRKEASLLSQTDAASKHFHREEQRKKEICLSLNSLRGEVGISSAPAKESYVALQDEAGNKDATSDCNNSPTDLNVTPQFVSTCSVTFMNKSVMKPKAGNINHQSPVLSVTNSLEYPEINEEMVKESSTLDPEGSKETLGSEVTSGTQTLSKEEIGSEESERNANSSHVFTQETTGSTGRVTDKEKSSPATFCRQNIDNKEALHPATEFTKPESHTQGSGVSCTETSTVPRSIVVGPVQSLSEVLTKISEITATKSPNTALGVAKNTPVSSAPDSNVSPDLNTPATNPHKCLGSFTELSAEALQPAKSLDSPSVDFTSALECNNNAIEMVTSLSDSDPFMAIDSSPEVITNEFDSYEPKTLESFTEVFTCASAAKLVDSSSKVRIDASFSAPTKTDSSAVIVIDTPDSLALMSVSEGSLDIPRAEALKPFFFSQTLPTVDAKADQMTSLETGIPRIISDGSITNLPASTLGGRNEGSKTNSESCLNTESSPELTDRDLNVDINSKLVEELKANLFAPSASICNTPQGDEQSTNSKTNLFSCATNISAEGTFVLPVQSTTAADTTNVPVLDVDLMTLDPANALQEDHEQNPSNLNVMQENSVVPYYMESTAVTNDFKNSNIPEAPCPAVDNETTTGQSLGILGDAFPTNTDYLALNLKGQSVAIPLGPEPKPENPFIDISLTPNSSTLLSNAPNKEVTLLSENEQVRKPPPKPPRLLAEHFTDNVLDSCLNKVTGLMTVEGTLKKKDNGELEIPVTGSVVHSSNEVTVSDHYRTCKSKFLQEGSGHANVEEKVKMRDAHAPSSPFEIISSDQSMEAWQLQPDSSHTEFKRPLSGDLGDSWDKSCLKNQGNFRVKEELNTSDLMFWSAEELKDLPAQLQESSNHNKEVYLNERTYSIQNRPAQPDNLTATLQSNNPSPGTAAKNQTQNEGDMLQVSGENKLTVSNLPMFSELLKNKDQERASLSHTPTPSDLSYMVSQDPVIEFKPDDFGKPQEEDLQKPQTKGVHMENPLAFAISLPAFSKNNPFSTIPGTDQLSSSVSHHRKELAFKDPQSCWNSLPEAQMSKFLVHDSTPLASSTPSLVAATNSEFTHFPSPILSSSTVRPAAGTTQAAAPSSFRPPPPIASAFTVLPEETQPADHFLQSHKSSPHPVKPLSSAASQEEKKMDRSVLSSGLEKLKSTIHPARNTKHGDPEAERLKAMSTDGVASYYHLTHDELITLLLEREKELEKKGADLHKMALQVRDLEDYIDTLLVRIMEQTPTLLQVKPTGK